MTTPERVYALLVEANPIEDPDSFLAWMEEDARPLHLVEPRSIPMQTQEATEQTTRTRRGSPRVALTAAAAFLAVILAGVIVALIGGDETAPVIDDAPAPTQVEEAPGPEVGLSNADQALEAVDAFYAALGTNDMATIERIAAPGGELSQADREMWGMNAELSALGYGIEPETCEADAREGATIVEVRCEMAVANPVFVAVGVEELVAPFSYFTETGALAWRPFQGGDFSLANRATADYLKAFHPDAYATACDPASYDAGSINANASLALTRSCGALYAPLVEDIAAWVEAGQPAPLD